MAKTRKEKKSFLDKIKESPINYFSDLFVCAMVILWIVDAVYESVMASAVTLSSIIVSMQTGTNCYDTTMWSSIGSNIAIPLSAGSSMWMIKNCIQHNIANKQGKQAHMDFPKVDVEAFEPEEPMFCGEEDSKEENEG